MWFVVTALECESDLKCSLNTSLNLIEAVRINIEFLCVPTLKVYDVFSPLLEMCVLLNWSVTIVT